MLVQRLENGGFEVIMHDWHGHCPHEEAVIRRLAAYFNLPVPDQPSGRLRASVWGFNVHPLHNGYYVRVNLDREYVPTSAAAMQKILALFDDRTSASASTVLVRKPAVASSMDDTLILERITEGRQAVRTLQERVEALRAMCAPTPEQLTCEEKHLDELLDVLKDALDIADVLANVGRCPLSAHSDAGNALCYISTQLVHLQVAVESWIHVRQHPDSGPKWRRRSYEELMGKARKRTEVHLRNWARHEERGERLEADPGGRTQ